MTACDGKRLNEGWKGVRVKLGLGLGLRVRVKG